MARVRFTDDYDYKPVRSCTIGYTAGWEGTVKQDCAEKVVAAGKAIRIDGRASLRKRIPPDANAKIGG